MGTEYRRIEVDLGTELDEAIKTLRKYSEQGEKVCIEYNGQILYSDADEDQIYTQITGRTKAEYIELVESETKKFVDKYKAQ